MTSFFLLRQLSGYGLQQFFQAFGALGVGVVGINMIAGALNDGFAFGIMRIGGALTFLIVAGMLIVFFRRERKNAARLEADGNPHAEAVS